MTAGADPPVRNSAICHRLHQQQGVVFPAAPLLLPRRRVASAAGPLVAAHAGASGGSAYQFLDTREQRPCLPRFSPPQPPNPWHLRGLRRGWTGHRQRTSYAFSLMDSSVGADACRRATKECHDAHQINPLIPPSPISTHVTTTLVTQSRAQTHRHTYMSLVCLLLS